MAKLNDLTVSLLNKLAIEIGIKFDNKDKKSDKIAKIENIGLDELRLNQIIQKLYMQKLKKKKRLRIQFQS